jgi:predicted AAA+ superfamily ATPase
MQIESLSFNLHDRAEPMERTEFTHKIKNAFAVNPIVALLGPRQAGKTTLA